MKIINKVMVFVMGLVVIGVVSTTIGVVTQPKNVEKSVTFEVLENDELSYNAFDFLFEYSIFDTNNLANNVVTILVNNDNNTFNSPYILYEEYDNELVISDEIDEIPTIRITPTSTNSDDLNVGDVITITLEVEQETPLIIRTLLLLTPLILSASLIGYLSLTVRSGKNE